MYQKKISKIKKKTTKISIKKFLGKQISLSKEICVPKKICIQFDTQNKKSKFTKILL